MPDPIEINTSPPKGGLPPRESTLHHDVDGNWSIRTVNDVSRGYGHTYDEQPIEGTPEWAAGIDPVDGALDLAISDDGRWAAVRDGEVRAERDALAVACRNAARVGLVAAMNPNLSPRERKQGMIAAGIALDKDMKLDLHGRQVRQLDREEEMDQQIAAMSGIGSIFDAKELEDENFSDTDGMFLDDRDEPP